MSFRNSGSFKLPLYEKCLVGLETAPVSDVRIDILNPSFQYGLNVFDTFRAYLSDKNQYQFLDLSKHFNRLKTSALDIGFSEVEFADKYINAVKSFILNENFRQDLYVKIIAYPQNHGSWSYIGPAQLITLFYERESKPTAAVSLGIPLRERIDQLNMPPGIKTGANYINSRYGFIEARKENFDYPLFLDRYNNISESSGANIIFGKDKIIETPLNSGAQLSGITKWRILNWLSKQGYTINERPISASTLSTYDYAFLCGTAVEILPVKKIQGQLFDADVSFELRRKFISAARTMNWS